MCVHSHIYSQEGHCDLFYPSNVLIFRFLPLANLTMTTRWQSLCFFFFGTPTLALHWSVCVVILTRIQSSTLWLSRILTHRSSISDKGKVTLMKGHVVACPATLTITITVCQGLWGWSFCTTVKWRLSQAIFIYSDPHGFTSFSD